MGKVVYLEWEDSSSAAETGWQHTSGWEGYSPIICHSIGRVIFEDARQIVLAPHWHTSGDGLRIQGAMRIPKSAIRRRLVVMVNSKKRGSRK